MWKRLGRGRALALLCLTWAGGAHAAAPSAADFATGPSLSGITVSPDNTKAAMLVRGEQGRVMLAVVNLAQPDKIQRIKGFADADITRVMWVNERRLAYSAWRPGVEVDWGGAGAFAIDADGSNERQLIAWQRHTDAPLGTRIRERLLPYDWFLWQTVDDGSDDVLVDRRDMLNTDVPRDRYLSRLNTNSGNLRSLSFGQPSGVRDWVFDRSGEMRLTTSTIRGRTRLHARVPGTGEWQLLQDEDMHSPQVMVPLFMEGAEQVVVSSRQAGDTKALYLYDLKQRKLDPEPLVAVQGFDLDGNVEVDAKAGRVVAYHTQIDRPMTVWFDERLIGAQQAVDKALPGRFNRLMCGRCLSADHFVVRSSGDRISAEYLVYDRKQGRLSSLGVARPGLPEDSQGRRSFHRVPARDGLSLPVVVTHPAGKPEKEPLPTVLLVHGGPWVRGTTREWQEEPQFLASRGWRVIEVDFRGSAGLGWKHFSAGFGQWGQAMQDDLIDALDWAVREKLADKDKVCIVGGSYGGFAALMGPVRHPDRYRCAVSFAGVTDQTMLFSSRWNDFSDDLRRYSLTQTVGDPERDAAKLRQNSPLHRVAEIKVPLLVLHGALDQRVDQAHARRFVSAARDAGVAVEYFEYFDEGHGFSLSKNQADYYQRVATFIEKVFAAPVR